MEKKKFASEAGHWYAKDGTPAYEVLGKDGAPRKTTLRDARKFDLLPSVTTIIRCAVSEGLERWKRNTPDWETISREAAEKGSGIHGSIECYLTGKALYDEDHHSHVMGAVGALHSWCGLDNLLPERSFAHPLGYGGKCDIHKKVEPFPGFVADFKSKDFNDEYKLQTYDNHRMQLAAYREGFDMPNARGAIIYVSTQVPGLTQLVEIDQDDLAQGWEMFCGLLDYWKAKNGF